MAYTIELPGSLVVSDDDITSVTPDYNDQGMLSVVYIWTIYDHSAPSFRFEGEQAHEVLAIMDTYDIAVAD